MNCYNCGSSLHLSAQCMERQKYTRCPSCNKVAQTAERHDRYCPSKQFKSQVIINKDTVFELRPLLRLEFQDIEDLFTVHDVNRELEIRDVPMWLSLIESYVARDSDRSLVISGSRPMTRQLVILDKNDTAVVSFVHDENCLVVNGRYNVYQNGWISYRTDVRNDIDPAMVFIKLKSTAKVFKMRVHCFEKKYVFDVYPIGAIFRDP